MPSVVGAKGTRRSSKGRATSPTERPRRCASMGKKENIVLYGPRYGGSLCELSWLIIIIGLCLQRALGVMTCGPVGQVHWARPPRRCWCVQQAPDWGATSPVTHRAAVLGPRLVAAPGRASAWVIAPSTPVGDSKAELPHRAGRHLNRRWVTRFVYFSFLLSLSTNEENLASISAPFLYSPLSPDEHRSEMSPSLGPISILGR